MLKQYLYISTALDDLNQDEINKILLTSRRNNEKYDLSGILLYRPPHFVQLLEGPEGKVDFTAARIGKDKRHREIEVLHQGKTAIRIFPDWKMGFIQGNVMPSDLKSHLYSILNKTGTHPSNDEILEVLAVVAEVDLSHAQQEAQS